ncbi:MAG: hypothetical protein HYY93_03015 [Planctomycetes bacterium]|nr:hypothetical protein [Planctomycetota bacterium]
MNHRRLILTSLLFAAGAAMALNAGDSPRVVEEKYASGALKIRYPVDEAGERHGLCTEFYEDGKTLRTSLYEHGVLSGRLEEFDPGGWTRLKKIYTNGRLESLSRYDAMKTLLHHVSFTSSAVLYHPPGARFPVNAHPRSVEEIRKRLALLESAAGKATPFDPGRERYLAAHSLVPPHKAGALEPDYLKDALRYTQTYRYLAEVPSELLLDKGLCDFAQHGAAIIRILNTLTHDPPRPADMEEAFHQKAFEGAHSGNVGLGYKNLREAIDGWMDDSDDRNIVCVGHRVWLLAPRLKKIGFGEVDGAQTVWVRDESGSPKRSDIIYYPAPGYFPAEYFGPEVAWSLSFDPTRFPETLGNEAKAEMWLLDAEYDLATPLPFNHTSYHPATWGAGLTLIFRPELPKDFKLAGQKFLVKVAGAQSVARTADRKTGVTKATRTDVPIAYIVEFFDPAGGGK